MALGETLFYSAGSVFADGYYGRAREFLVSALQVCLKSFLLPSNSEGGSRNRQPPPPNCRSLWKLVGDCCLRFCTLFPAAVNRKDGTDSSELDDTAMQLIASVDGILSTALPQALNWLRELPFQKMSQLPLLASKSFIACLGLLLAASKPDSAAALPPPQSCRQLSQLCWYQLSIALSFAGSNDAAVKCLRLALRLSRGQNCSAIWNALGVLYAKRFEQQAVSAASISQHCFIKAIDSDPLDPVAWSNLGVLYLLVGDRQLALQSFQHSQSLDPEWTLGTAFIFPFQYVYQITVK
jgi:tetratricopeptide (TPR) repeat protein